MHNRSSTLIKHAATWVLATLWSTVQAADFSGSATVIYGHKYLDQGDWGPIESQSELGVGITYQVPEWPVPVVGYLLSSSGSGTDSKSFASPVKATGKTTELSGGARKNLTEGSTKVFVEGGLVYIAATLNATNLVTGASDRGTSSALGLWLGGGLDAMLTPTVSVGGLIRMSKADAKGDSLGGTHFGLYAAFHFQP